MRYRIIGLALALALVGLIVVYVPVQDYTVVLLHWVDGLGFGGYAAFIVLYIAFTVMFLPGFILTVGAGAVFGLTAGFLVVSLGSTVGASLAFLLGRFVARDMVESKVAANRKFSAIDAAVGRQGWKIVMLTRLTPIFPFNLINYAYGLTRIPFWHYALASWIGMMPGTLVYVYIGSLAGGVTRAAVGEGAETGTLEMVMQAVGLLATIAVTVYITQLARKALNEELPPSANEDAGGDREETAR